MLIQEKQKIEHKIKKKKGYFVNQLDNFSIRANYQKNESEIIDQKRDEFIK